MRLDDSVVREIFRLRKAEGKSYAAIARATGVSERTVRRRLDRAAEIYVKLLNDLEIPSLRSE